MKTINYILLKLKKIGILNSIDIQFAFSIVTKNDPYLILAIAYLSAENRSGHSYLSLHVLQKLFKKHNLHNMLHEKYEKISNLIQWKDKLSKFKVIGNLLCQGPIVLSGNSLYLYRIWKQEVKFKKFLYSREYFPFNYKKHKIIYNYFKKICMHLKRNKWKIEAIYCMYKYNPSWLLGSKNSGKNYFVFDILLILLKLNYKNYFNILLVVLNKKSIVFFKKQLRYLKKKHLKNNFSISFITFHKFLNSYLYNQHTISYYSYPIYYDLMIIYDISVLDLSLINYVIDIYQNNSGKIIFIGNHLDLKNIEKGSILKQLIFYLNRSKDIFYKTRNDNIVEYDILSIEKKPDPIISNYLDNIYIIKKEKNYKIHPNIRYLSKLIKIKNFNRTKKFLNENIYNGIKYIDLKNQEDYQNMILKIFFSYVKYLNRIKKNINNIEYILNNFFKKFRVICIARNSYLGEYRLNYIIENMIKSYLSYKYNLLIQNDLYTGRLVISKINYSSLGIGINDLGVIINHGIKSYVFFYKKKNLSNTI
ncbi:MAG: exodeoxyribonuclease V subunit beta [Wigglesworthia glossinidia]|nr:exodeoxyribonuclease V subunit beta [Wigglesworthia glossinidia]